MTLHSKKSECETRWVKMRQGHTRAVELLAETARHLDVTPSHLASAAEMYRKIHSACIDVQTSLRKVFPESFRTGGWKL